MPTFPGLHLYIKRVDLGFPIPLMEEKAMAPHSSTLAWKIPWTEEPGRLQSMGLLRVGHDWTTSPFTFQFHALEKEMATHSSVLAWRIPGMGEPGGLLSVGSHRVGHDWSGLAASLWWKCRLNYKRQYAPITNVLFNITIILKCFSQLKMLSMKQLFIIKILLKIR